jgi:hypothetical protein
MILIHRGQALAEGAPEDVLGLIDQFPHQILFQAPYTELQRLSVSLIQASLVNNISFTNIESASKKSPDLIATTDNPGKFYYEVTRLIAKENIHIQHLESRTDNIEAIFEFLT